MYKLKQKKGKKMDPEISYGTRKLSLISQFKKIIRIRIIKNKIKGKSNFPDSHFQNQDCRKKNKKTVV